ncbi:type II secretion system protein (plasmid) [Paraburkholderia sp. D15]|uniref:type II secretion system protein n=1 Tax=Paraburkholderia sp. D15 TaxID=2880218 RepID=UPI00247A0C2F|nr:type II secretion system protein [Paraburkholderia sp. D15]WGS55107.1 type II secretion system protein [Paraburkholderia sp. D15]
MMRRLIHAVVMRLPENERMRIATWRFHKARESFYRETRLDVTTKGLRNRETLLERLGTHEERSRKRNTLLWPVYRAVGARMRAGDTFAQAMKPFIPSDEYALLELASTSTREDAAVRGLELAEMAANAKRVLSGTTSAQMAYPAFLIVYLYALCMLFGGAIYPQALDVKPLDQWPAAGQVLYAIDTFCYEKWWLSASLVTGAVFTYFSTLRRWTGDTRNRFDAAPLMWRNRRDLRAALLIVSLSGLFDSGLTLRAALDRLSKTADPWLKWHLNRMSRRLTATPHQPMRALDTGIFSDEIVDTVSDAAARDQFIAAIKALGRESLARVVESVRRNAKITHYVLLGFAALIFLGLGVGSYVMTGAVSLDLSGTPSTPNFVAH